MEVLFPIFFIALFIGFPILISVIKAIAASASTRVLTSGVPARGLVLSVSQTGFAVLQGGTRYERRTVVLDVEMPGRPPFQIQGQPLIPKYFVRNVLPGTFVELRMDSSKPQNFAVVGPGNVFFVS